MLVYNAVTYCNDYLFTTVLFCLWQGCCSETEAIAAGGQLELATKEEMEVEIVKTLPKLQLKIGLLLWWLHSHHSQIVFFSLYRFTRQFNTNVNKHCFVMLAVVVYVSCFRFCYSRYLSISKQGSWQPKVKTGKPVNTTKKRNWCIIVRCRFKYRYSTEWNNRHAINDLNHTHSDRNTPILTSIRQGN